MPLCRWIAPSILLFVSLSASVALAQLVPGTGEKIPQVGDDFEDPSWEYVPRLPKSTENLNEQQHLPTGESKNGRWYEGVVRGQPDVVQRVATPPGGLSGSEGALLLRSLQTGIPNRPSFKMQQDDFIASVNYRLGGYLPVHQSPSVVVRVFLPPMAEWEQRTGCTFAFRAAVDTRIPKKGLLTSSSQEREVYYPGFFIELERSKESGTFDTAYFRIRADRNGRDYRGPQITQTGWWTLGMSFTPDGQIHYYARPGVEDLTAEDHVASQYPYGYRCERLRTFFFNVCSGDDGRTWSTSWTIDDPTVYYVRQ